MSEPDNETIQDAILRHIDNELVEEADEVLTSVHLDRQQMHQAWNRATTLLLRQTPLQQFGVGFGIGWLSGYLFRRVSRTAAFLVGCSFLVVQGASALGIININWNQLRQVAQRRFSSRLSSVSGGSPTATSLSNRVVMFCRRHVYMTSGFTTGAVVAITF